MRIAAAIATFLAASCWLPAQNAAKPQSFGPPPNPAAANWQSTIVLPPSTVETCPLDLQVRQGVGGYSRAIGSDSPRMDGFASRLDMTLRDSRPNHRPMDIVAARVTVEGLNGRDHVMGLREDDERKFRITRTLTVRLDAGNSSEFSAQLRLAGFTATTWVQLLSVTFENGEVLTFAGSHACGVRPDPLMLVSQK